VFELEKTQINKDAAMSNIVRLSTPLVANTLSGNLLDFFITHVDEEAVMGKTILFCSLEPSDASDSEKIP
jgi:hypothetical protein